MKKLMLLGLMVVVVLGSVGAALADFTAPTVSTTEFMAVATVVIGAYAAIWGIKRAIGLAKR